MLHEADPGKECPQHVDRQHLSKAIAWHHSPEATSTLRHPANQVGPVVFEQVQTAYGDTTERRMTPQSKKQKGGRVLTPKAAFMIPPYDSSTCH